MDKADTRITETASKGVVLIVEDDEEMRTALVRLFRSVGLETRAMGSARELEKTGLPEGPCCLVLDVRLPGTSGLDIQQDLVGRGVVVPMIFMTGYGDIPMSVRAMKSGALDFLPKPFRDQDMLDAVSSALDQDRERLVLEQETERLRRRFESLTPREREIMSLVVQGLMNKQIAWDLGLSEITVKIHRGKVMKKMAARSLPDLVRMAQAVGAEVSN